MRHKSIAALCLFLAASPLFAAVTGTVMTREGQPVSGAKVSLMPFESHEAMLARLLANGAEPEALGTATSDGKGNFSLPSPKELTAVLRIDANGYKRVTQRVERDEELGAMILRSVSTKTGRVTANGKPVPNARVIWWENAGEVLSIATTDAEGRYSGPDPQSAAAVTVLHPDFGINEELYGRGGVPPRVMDRTLVAGREAKGIVYASDGKTPVAKAAILVDGWPLAVSGDDGTFTIPHLQPKWTSMIAVSGNQRALRRFAKDNMLTFRLEKAATLRGTVRDLSQNVIANALVRVSSGGQPMSDELFATALTDAKGNYSVNVSAGMYRVTASHPSFSPEMPQVSLTAGQQLTKEIALTPYARVSGTVIDEEQRPVAAASLNPAETMDGMFRGGRIFNPAFSGPDGRFTMKIAPDREIRVRAMKKGLPESKSDPLRVAAGERKRGLTIVIPSGVAVTGRITDRDGNPLSGVNVSAAEAQQNSSMRMIFISGPNMEDESVQTGSDGTFLIRLREGTYDFTFRREGYSAKAMRSQQVTTATRPLEATLDPAVEMSGRVVRNGAGLEGVMISAMSADQPSFSVTAADGSFTLTGLSAGMTRLMIRKEDSFVQDQRNIQAPARDVVIELPAGGTITGRVIDKASRKPVTTFQAGVSTSRSSGGMMMVTPPMLRSFTTEDGSFTLENVPVGAVNVVVQAPGYAQGRKSGLTLEEGKTLSDIEVELDTGTRLVGKVTGPDGAALSGVTVRESPVFSRSSVVAPSRSDLRTTSEASGEYVLDSLEPGEKTFEFSHPKYLAARKTVDVKGREVRVDVKLEAGARVTGTVVTDSGAAIADARVEAIAGGPMMMGNTVKTDASGQFAFESLEPGRYTFRATKPGYAEGEVEDVDISASPNIRVQLGRGGVIYGRVIGLSEAEYPHTYVEARGSEGSASSSVDATGSYRIEGAPKGTSRVSATVSRDFSARKTSQVQTVQLEAGGSQQIDLEFRTDVVIRGRVTRDGRALTGGQISFYPRNATASTNASAPIDDLGLYSVSGLEEGEYSVTVTDTQRLSPYATTYRVSGPADFDIDYRTVSVRGRVMDSENSEPLVDVRVQLKPAATETMMMQRGALTDANGNFAIDFVPAGSYNAVAEKDGFAMDQRPIQVTESSAPDLDFRLMRSDGLRITVVDARDRRSLNASVRATDGAGRIYDSDFRLGNEAVKLAVPPGQYRVTVSANGYAPQTFTLNAPSQQTVALTRGGTVVIRSRESARRRIRLMGANGAHMSPGRTMVSWFALDPNGETTIVNVQPGQYTLQVLGDNDAVLDQTPVTVTEGQKTFVDL